MQTNPLAGTTFRTLAIVALVATTFSTAFAQLQPIISSTIPTANLVALLFVPTETNVLLTDAIAAPVNSSRTGSFRVKADGPVAATVKLTHTGDRNANHTVKVQLIKPNGTVAASNDRVIVKYNTPTEITLRSTASISESGCSGTNLWVIKVTNTDDVNEQTTSAAYTVTTPTATSTRATYPAAAFSLAQGASIDRVFSIPAGHNGTVTIKATYTGTAPIKLHLFKPGAVPVTLLGAVKTQTLTASTQSMTYTVNAADVAAGAADTFWHIVALNTGTGATDANVVYEVKFVDCFE
jgi:hypothetical protein